MIRVRPQEAAAHPERFAGVAQLVDRQLDRLHRQHRDPEQPVGVGLAVIGEPAVVGAAHRTREPGVGDGAGEQTEARVEERGVDAVGVHVDDAGVRVEPALFPLGIFEGVGLDRPWRTPTAPRLPIPRGFPSILPSTWSLSLPFSSSKPRPALAERRVHVAIPQVERLEDVAVGIDNVISAGHRHSLRWQSDPAVY